jgi:hypothetical protein
VFENQITSFHNAVWEYCPSAACNAVCPSCVVYPGPTPVFQATADCYKCLADNNEQEQFPAITTKCSGTCAEIAECVLDCKPG